MKPQGRVRWVFGRFFVGRATHRALVWDGRRESALVVRTVGFGFWRRQVWHWE